MQHDGISVLTLAIVFGTVVGDTPYPRVAADSAIGVGLSKQILLRTRIVLYGLRLTSQDIVGAGLHGVLLDALMLASIFGLACLFGVRLFDLDRTTTLLVGADSSVCGATAVMAIEPITCGRIEQVVAAVSAVVVFGTLDILPYPALFQPDQDWRLSPCDLDTWDVHTSATVHEVAQTVVMGRSVGIEAADTAMIAKTARAMMLTFSLILPSAWLVHDKAYRRQYSGVTKTTIPRFVVGSVLVTGPNSLISLPLASVGHANDLDTFLLAVAMVGLGLGTHLLIIRRASLKSLLLAALLSAWLVPDDGLSTRSAPVWVLRQETLRDPSQDLVQGLHLVDTVVAQAVADQSVPQIEPYPITHHA